MAKVTYSLKPQTVDRVQELATAWGISKSEVVRRAIDEASKRQERTPSLTPLQALNELQQFAGLTAEQARKFEKDVRLSRLASGRRRG